MKKLIYSAIALLLVVAVGCSNNNGWKLSGEIANCKAVQKICIEGYNNGNWYVVDSIALDGNGSFEYVAEAPAKYPDIMRLTLDGRSVYFPIDSVDNISIVADADNFGVDYNIEGSLHATTMHRVDSILNASVAAVGADSTIVDVELKKQLFSAAMDDSSVLSVYYLINKAVGDKQLFDLSDRGDLRYYGAVAQRFITERPNDPRTKYLEARYRQARQAFSHTVAQVENIPETGLFDIIRYDLKGNKCSLSEVASKGNVVLLSFTSYQLESSVAYNVILNEVWEKYHDAGLEIYQIAFDGDESMWRMRAANIPWTAVWNSTTDGVDPMIKYNVGQLPTTFIIDRDGNIAMRVVDPSTLSAEVKKYI